MKYLLFYEYVPDVEQRRAPLRTEHLAMLTQLRQGGRLAMAGAYTDPLDGAVLVFNDCAAAEEFVRHDPYVANGLVVKHHIREWNVVVG